MKRSHIIFVLVALWLAASGACTLPTPTPPGGIAANNQNHPIPLPVIVTPAVISPNSPLLEACTPPALSLNSANGWCSNYTTKTGGVTINMSGEKGIFYTNNVGVSCNGVQGQFICTGPQNASFQISACTHCGGGFPAGQGPTSDKDFGTYTCSTGYVTDPANGNCKPGTSGYPDGACPAGSHYDNSQQWCVDNTTNQKISDLCPAGAVAYLPGFHVCLLKPLSTPMVFDCQTWTVSVGDCTLKHNPGGAPPVKCTYGSGPPTCK